MTAHDRRMDRLATRLDHKNRIRGYLEGTVAVQLLSELADTISGDQPFRIEDVKRSLERADLNFEQELANIIRVALQDISLSDSADT